MTAPSTVRVPVLMENWQIECCGDPPGVGDTVDWRLRSAGENTDRLGPAIGDWRLTAPLRALVSSPVDSVTPGAVLAVAELGGLSVHHPTSEIPPPAAVTLTGTLAEDHHAGIPRTVPKTTGTVCRVRLVSVRMRCTAPRSWSLVTGSAELTEVTRSPKCFQHDYPEAPRNGAIGRSQLGVLVELEVLTTNAR
jgi:hypothetical protein